MSLYKAISWCLSATPGPSAQCNNSYNPQKVVMIEAQAQQEKFSPDQDGGGDIEAADQVKTFTNNSTDAATQMSESRTSNDALCKTAPGHTDGFHLQLWLHLEQQRTYAWNPSLWPWYQVKGGTTNGQGSLQPGRQKTR